MDMEMDNEIEIDDDPILGNNEENEPKKKRSKAKNSSFVWDHFTKKAKPKELPTNYKEKATCNYCGTEFTCNSDNNGTSSMRTHLVKRCREYDLSEWYIKKHGGDKRQKTLGFEPVVVGNTAPKLTATSFSAEACRNDVVSVVDHENAFENVLEGEVIGGGSERGKGKGRGRELGTPTSDDWNVVAMYVEILRTFYIVTERLLGSLYVTCNTFYKEVTTVKNAISKMELSDDPKLLMLAKGMHLKFDKYWGKFEKINQFLLYANVLDPRYKFEYVRWSLRKYLTEREVESKVVEIKEGMKKVYNWYEKRTIENEERNVDESRIREKNATRVMDLSEALDSEFDQHMEEETNMVSKSELERYWLEAMEDRKNEKFDLLTWWSTNCSRYHILSQMARDILAIPVSTVASESAFSTGGRILDPYRTSLSPKMAEALICAQNWLRYPCEIFLRDQLDEIEELESVVMEAFEDSCVTEL